MIFEYIGKFWREALIVALLVVVFVSIKSSVHKSDAISILQNSRDSAFIVARYYKNREGDLIGQIKTHEVTIKELKNFSDDLGVELKRMRSQIGSLNNLVAFWKGKAEYNNTDTLYIPVADTTIQDSPAKWFSWSDQNLTLDGVLRIDQNYVTLSYNYQFATDFKLTSYYKGGGLFKKRQLVTDMHFSDPHLRVNEFRGIVIKQPPKKWYETRAFAFGAGFVLASYLWLK